MALCSIIYSYVLSYSPISYTPMFYHIVLYHILLCSIIYSYIIYSYALSYTPISYTPIMALLYLSASHRATCIYHHSHHSLRLSSAELLRNFLSLSPGSPVHIYKPNFSLSLLSSPVFDYEFKT